MCGISGYVLLGDNVPSTRTILAMNEAIAHRGPDDTGVVLLGRTQGKSPRHTLGGPGSPTLPPDAVLPHRVAVGHKRFSIVDLSPGGHQPFWSESGRTMVAFNGEIYNHVELRRELSRLGRRFRTTSDTEVLVEAYEEWGPACFTRFVGFWALALWDETRKQLLLCRDRLGKAPLYVVRTADALWFSSEIKGLIAAVPGLRTRVNPQAIDDYIRYAWRDLGNETFFEGVTTFPRASLAWVEEDGTYQAQPYWELPQRRLSEAELPVGEAILRVRETLDSAVQTRLRADVPIGFELSGGLDSSSIVALAASKGAKVHAYTTAFRGTEADEEAFARLVVDKYRSQIEYTVLEPPDTEFFSQANEFVWLIGEPFRSPNLLTNQTIWKAMAKQGIRVTLNGAAGDEAFAGYPDYVGPLLNQLLRQGRVRAFVREIVLARDRRDDHFRSTLRSVAAGFAPHGWRREKTLEGDPYRAPEGIRRRVGPSRKIEALLVDFMSDWLMNYWLRSGNQSYMGVPIELRAPFLDHRLVELAFRLPVSYLIHDGWRKWIVRQAMRDLLPAEVAWRTRKAGFPFPLRQWLGANRQRFFTAVAPLDCPWVDPAQLEASYDGLATSDPSYLWRLMGLALWWKRCVQGQAIG